MEYRMDHRVRTFAVILMLLLVSSASLPAKSLTIIPSAGAALDIAIGEPVHIAGIFSAPIIRNHGKGLGFTMTPTIFAGGEDFMAFLPLGGALSWAYPEQDSVFHLFAGLGPGFRTVDGETDFAVMMQGGMGASWHRAYLRFSVDGLYIKKWEYDMDFGLSVLLGFVLGPEG